jgi:hypothetical protein
MSNHVPAQTEGTDLNSWVANRSRFRDHAQANLKALEDCHERLVSAVGKRHADPAMTFDVQSVTGITALTQEAVTALRAAEAEWSQLASAREAANSQLQSTRQEIERAAQQRARKEADQTAARNKAALARQFWMKRMAMKLAAIGVVLAMFYVVFGF